MSATKKQLVTVYTEPASGPGWANAPLWIIWRDDLGKLHEDCLQPDDQSNDIRTLYGTCAAAHAALMRATRSAMGEYR